MSYHLCDHIYIAQFRDEIILLDAKRDQYTICLKHISNLLISILEGKESNLKENDVVQCLLDEKIIEEKDPPFPFLIDRKPNSDGVSNVDWRLPLENKKVSFNFEVLKALLILTKVNFYIKVRGFYNTIQLIKKNHKKKANCDSGYIIPKDDELRDLANIVNKACLIYPTRTKCLEWAITFVLVALKRGWKCNLEVGVQNYPFMAHAWVECNEKVIIDSQTLREGLAIILNEPFRRLKV